MRSNERDLPKQQNAGVRRHPEQKPGDIIADASAVDRPERMHQILEGVQ